MYPPPILVFETDDVWIENCCAVLQNLFEQKRMQMKRIAGVLPNCTCNFVPQFARYQATQPLLNML
jgi:hypothetical protein